MGEKPPPPVDEPGDHAREQALGRLEQAIAAEPADAYPPPVGARAERRTAPLTRGRASTLDGVRGGDGGGRVRRRGRRRLPGLGGVVSSLAVLVALVIAGGALVLLHHAHTGSGSTVAVAAARGEILDRNGNVLVGDRPVYAIQINPAALPSAAAARASEYALLARLIGASVAPVGCSVPDGGVLRLAAIECAVAQQARALALATVATDVSPRVVAAVSQDKAELSGVSVKRVFLRAYPYGSLAAQVFGTVGPITAAETHNASDKGVPRTAYVGQSGLEYGYDSALRDGDSLRTSLNVRLQKAGEAALARAISQNPPATGGAFVAMNPQNGEVYAMGSAPTFNPTIFTQPISEAGYQALTSSGGNHPLMNRAIDSPGPTGSTFTPITALPALQSGAWLPDETFDDTGRFCINTMCLHNADAAVYGVLDLAGALRVSSNVLFDDLGAKLNADPVSHPGGGALQQWARALGVGQPTGIDLPGEDTGTLPTPAWRAQQNALEQQCENATGPYTGRPKHPASSGGCGIAVLPPETWTAGDNINLAVGQGDVQLTPLQLAVAYAALANGGTIVAPHLGLDIQSATGTVLKTIDPSPVRHLDINPSALDAIRADSAPPLRGPAAPQTT